MSIKAWWAGIASRWRTWRDRNWQPAPDPTPPVPPPQPDPAPPVPVPPAPVPPPTPPADDWRSKQERLNVPSGATRLSFRTRGMQSQPGRNGDGGWEYIFLTLRGNGFDRVLLYQVGGGRKQIRARIDGPDYWVENNLRSDNLPGEHAWLLDWAGGRLRVYLDGKQIVDRPFRGQPTRAIVGGYDSAGRDWRGQHRDAQAGVAP